jgi:hypothetical protein
VAHGKKSRKLDILDNRCNFNSTIFSKGFTFTSFQYIVFTIVAIFWLFRMEENLRQLPNGTTKIIKIALFGPECREKPHY